MESLYQRIVIVVTLMKAMLLSFFVFNRELSTIFLSLPLAIKRLDLIMINPGSDQIRVELSVTFDQPRERTQTEQRIFPVISSTFPKMRGYINIVL